MTRTVAVARMYAVDRLNAFVMPVAILALTFVINLVVWQFAPPEARVTGGVLSLPCFMLVAAILGVTRGLAFSLSLGATRHQFAAGMGLTAALLAVGFGSFLYLLCLLEVATGGWGMQGHFFSFPWYDSSPGWGTWLLYTASILALYLCGGLAASVWVRFGSVGMFVASLALLLVGGGAIVLVTAASAWSSVWGWVGALTPLSLSGWLLVVSAVAAAAAYALVRRASV